MKKIFKIIISVYLLTIPFLSFAQGYTLLPQGKAQFVKSPVFCRSLMDAYLQVYFTQDEDKLGKYNTLKRFNKATNCTLQKIETNSAVNQLINLNTPFTCSGSEDQSANLGGMNQDDILACAFISGRFDIVLVKPLLQYVLKLLSVLAGTISMLFIILGGYKYFAGVITGDVTDAKGTVKNAILGLVLATCSWIIVDIIVTLLIRGE